MSTTSSRPHARARDDQRVWQLRIRVGQAVLEPGPVRTCARTDRATAPRAAAQFLDGRSPRMPAGTRRCRAGDAHARGLVNVGSRQRRVKELRRRGVPARVGGAADDGAERPERAAVTILRALLLEPVAQYVRKLRKRRRDASNAWLTNARYRDGERAHGRGSPVPASSTAPSTAARARCRRDSSHRRSAER